ncbi:short chain dehydrogenase [Usnea florida]
MGCRGLPSWEYGETRVAEWLDGWGFFGSSFGFLLSCGLSRFALVTGASRGIGAGIALELASRGASVIVNYVKGATAAASICAQIQTMGSRALAIQADVSIVPEITRLFEESVSAFGKIDIVCSNSGMESFDKTEDITEERFDLVFGLNFRAQFFVAQHAYKYCSPGGRVILMSSIAAGLIGVADHALYNASKSAINGVTKSFAKDFGKRGITVNAIAPGGVKSDMFTQVAWKYIPGATGEWSKEAIEGAMAGHCPLGRCAVPGDVARVVAFLAGEDGGWVNGQIITISGGSGQ